MWIAFEPENSDLEEVKIVYGDRLVRLRRGEPKDLAEPIAKRMLEHSPELYRVSSAAEDAAYKAEEAEALAKARAAAATPSN